MSQLYIYVENNTGPEGPGPRHSLPNEQKFAESVKSVRVSVWNVFFLGSVFVEPRTPLFLI